MCMVRSEDTLLGLRPVSPAISLARVYLLAMASISSHVLGFFMMSFRTRDEFVSPFFLTTLARP
jgi:hypothetical protein